VRFVFDADVAAVFDDMAVRSIPGYNHAHDSIGAMVESVSLPDFTQVWDFGASTGKGLESVLLHAVNPLVHYYGCDTSQPMLEKARERLDVFEVNLFSHDLTTGLPRALRKWQVSVAIYAWTLQFIEDREIRRDLLRQTYEALAPGGMMFVFEKFVLADRQVNEVMQRAYMRFRRASYSLEEIEAKNRALANSMWPWAPEDRTTVLNTCGARWEWVYRQMNFGGVVAFKPVR
jgi:tRNA (cmo5U34)-methyltransferase